MIKSNLNKDTLLNYISPIEITLKALKLNDLPKSNISSPFTEDKNPSFQVFKNGSFKCYSSEKSGDCFQLVAELNSLDCKKDFNKVLEIVATENNLWLQLGVETSKTLVKPNKSVVKKGSKQIATTSTIEPQQFKFNSIKKINFEERHLLFWEKYGVTIETLKKYKVSAVQSYSFFSERKNKDCIFNFKVNEIAFCYEVNGRNEIYIPKQKERNKFYQNGLIQDDIFGLQQLNKKVENIIICAGKKDALVLNANGFSAVSFRSENQHLKKELIETLQQHCSELFICYDNDNAGLSAV
ncbi:CHC2 zinc finger domain-containing protein, partial [Flavobacterium sp.]|uniref:CHC2 zinc finger domain-containing protein n=1 Tax=Flavobacterium sp. TaxID=239 RepID=UPI0035270226